MPDVGDTATLTLTVSPHDATTSAAVTVISPSGVDTAPPVSTPDEGASWAAQVLLDEAGAWQATWTVTGTGAGVEADTVYAVALAGTAYATLSDLVGHLGALPPAGAARMLVRASRLVDRELIGAVYPVDTDGMPTSQEHATALRDAVCAQVETWAEAGYIPGEVATDGYASVSIGAVTLSNPTSSAGPPGGPMRSRLSPAAVDELRLAGLLQPRPYVYG